MVTSNVMVTEALAATVPRSTTTGGAPPLPLMIEPWVVVTEAATRVVTLLGMSLNITPVAAPLPLFAIVTW